MSNLTVREIEELLAVPITTWLETEHWQSRRSRLRVVAETCLAAMDRANKAEEALAKCECWNPGSRVSQTHGFHIEVTDCGECAPCLARRELAVAKGEKA